MQVTHTKVLLLALAIFAVPMGVYSQGWEKAFGSQHGDGLYDVLSLPDGGYLSVGHEQTSLAPLHHDLLLIKTDADGIEEWSQQITDTVFSYFGKSIQPTVDGGYIIGGTSLNENIPRGFLMKTDFLGNVEWEVKTTQDSVYGRKTLQLIDGSYLLTGSIFHPSVPDSLDYDFYQMRVDSSGAILQSGWYGGPGYDDCWDVAETAEGDILMAGYTSSFGAGLYDAYLLKINIDGDSLWSKSLGTDNAESVFAIEKTNDGNYIITGQSITFSQDSEDVFLAKIKPGGEILWWHVYEKGSLDLAYDVKQAAVGGYILTGYSKQNVGADKNAFLIKTYSNGEEHWKKHFGGVNHDGGFAVSEAANLGYVVAGFTNSYGQGGSDGYLFRTDFSGIANSCFIIGNVQTNENNSCTPFEFGGYVNNMIVEIAGDVTYFGTTDEFGNYSVPVNAGDYNVRLVNPSPYWELCEDSVNVNVSGSFDTSEVDFSLFVDTLCTYMRVDLSTLTMRQCFQNTYTVSYCNLGTMAAEPAEVEVTFDSYLNIDSTSIPWTSQLGNTYFFDVGIVDPFECGSFNVYFTVDCNSTVLGQTHCSEAHIFPDENCEIIDPQWDEASIELEAECNGDSVFFVVKNIGAGDMSGPLNLIVIEDVLMGFQATFQLESQQDTTFVFLANGATYRMEADQSPGHPGKSKPCISVEGCGNVGFSTGYVIQYPLNDADPFVDSDCRENTSSFDPNDKIGFPVGYSARHFIEPNTDIEYLIRFQNTGTDTALTVVIRDTLSRNLDPTSFVMGGSSHDMDFELYGNGILKFKFDNIMLPDSNVNEPASHGFVKFRIKQQLDLPIGTLIQNFAAIYFDHNVPVITEPVNHTVAENFIIGTVATEEVFDEYPLANVRTYPNPFVDQAFFELENIDGKDFTFRLFDVNGRQVREAFFDEKIFQFERRGIPGGIYFYRISQQGKNLFTGKIILK